MSGYQAFIKEIFDHFKCKQFFDILKYIPVYNPQNVICAYLRPINKDYKTTIPGCVALLTKWRKENPSISTGVFEVTDERTEKWLDNHIIGRDDRILFLIVDIDGKFIGHIGFSSFKYEKKSCEVDAVLRGVKNVYPGIMVFALNSLVYWGLQDLKLDHIKLKVFSDNTSAIKFYERCGFVFVKNIPLYKVILSGEEKWEIAPEGFNSRVEKYYTEMELDIAQWKELSKWMQA